jgi:predicted AlkP superfamily pyrophosphatase or phosphodiesterase
MDGFAGDYLGRVPMPFFERLMKEGAYSKEFQPVFPSLTFPSHCSESTGVAAGRHGIVANAFYDRETKKVYRFPGDSELLQSEPIWITAKRQGVRDLVFDWPLSQKELTPVRADYFAEKFDAALEDEVRLQRILDTWRKDAEAGGEPLRLLMGYVEGTDPAGHRFGPEAAEVGEELKKLDDLMGRFFDRALALWKVQAGPQDRIYFLFTTDHGMSAVEKSVSLEKVLDLVHGQSEITLVGSGNTANIYLDKVPEGEAREAQARRFMEAFKAYPFIQAWRQQDLPEKWAYGNSQRTGDIVAVLPKGYTFSSGPIAVTDKGVKGMHGYPVEQNAAMQGVVFVWSSTALGGKDLGEVKWDQYAPTVARWLGIQPPPLAKGEPLRLDEK